MLLTRIGIAILTLSTLLSCQPKPSMQDSEGAGFSLSDFRGSWVFINYWAVWCKPCLEEVQALNQLDAIQDIVVIGYNYDAPPLDKLRRQMQKLDIDFKVTVTRPDSLLGREAWPTVLPTTLLINPKGEWVQTLTGPQTVESLLGQIGRKAP